MATNLLTDFAIKAAIRAARTAKPPKPIKKYDGEGLYLLIDPRSDSALWRFRYLLQRREKLISFGKWPFVSLKLARERRQEARKLLAAGADPSAVRKAERAAGAGDSFEALAREWMAKQEDWCEAHRSKIAALLENDVFRFIGAKPVAELTPPDLLQVLRRIEARSKDQALRARQHCSNVFRYAIATARATSDPCRDLAGALATPPERHYPAITSPKELAQLLRDIAGYSGNPS
ncbi:MAG: tyrosine-type recombinase/integrase, partial [Steroidobacteraceae bacterium]